MLLVLNNKKERPLEKIPLREKKEILTSAGASMSFYIYVGGSSAPSSATTTAVARLGLAISCYYHHFN